MRESLRCTHCSPPTVFSTGSNSVFCYLGNEEPIGILLLCVNGLRQPAGLEPGERPAPHTDTRPCYSSERGR